MGTPVLTETAGSALTRSSVPPEMAPLWAVNEPTMLVKYPLASTPDVENT
jgi:hypothetical protein